MTALMSENDSNTLAERKRTSNGVRRVHARQWPTMAAMSLAAAHKGYEYQDLIAAVQLVDVLLEPATELHVDQKLTADDRFDDLTRTDSTAMRLRMQVKHAEDGDQALGLGSFTTDARKLRL